MQALSSISCSGLWSRVEQLFANRLQFARRLAKIVGVRDLYAMNQMVAHAAEPFISAASIGIEIDQ